MKKILLTILLLGTITGLRAQQDAHYSHYMFNGQVLNPAHCGSLDRIYGTMVLREQWLGVEGRPRTQVISGNGPSRDMRHGFGFVLSNDRYGVTASSRLAGQYAYRIKVGKNAHLALGIQASIHNWRDNLLPLRRQVENDPKVALNQTNRYLPNFGTGAYFSNRFFYLGFSVPEILENQLAKPNATLPTQPNLPNKEDRNAYGTAGFIVPLGKNLMFKPSTLIKINNAVPFSVDLNGMFLIKEKVWVGASYRLKDALVFLIDAQVSSVVRIGYSYDYTMSSLSDFTSGSHELMLGIDLNYVHHESVSPRFFR